MLGQRDFVHKASNDDNQDGVVDSNPTARTLRSPLIGVYSNGIQLFITDTRNHRVLVWNTFPIRNFTHATFNDNNQDNTVDTTPTDQTLYFPAGIFQYNNQLFVSDGSNNRYLIYNGNN